MDKCCAALGTDTGGSVRTPSAMCGVTGLKATYGRVSIRGIVPLTWSLDHCGPITKTVEDAATMLHILAGYDRLDLQSVDEPVPDYRKAIGAPVSGFRLGIPPQFYDGLQPEVTHAMDEATALLKKMTRGATDVVLPSILDTGANSEGALFREMLGGEFMIPPPAGGGFGAGRAVDYIRQWRNLRLVRRKVDVDVFKRQNVDVLITPTIRELPWPIEEELDRLADAHPRNPKPGNTRSLDDYGLPTITVPCGFSSAGLPIGLQISGAHLDEMSVLALAYAYQRSTDWHLRKPPLSPDAKVPVLSKTAASQTGEAVTR
jgi:aspartyl-tRNA(Asn)/glutamyl-tRNA(Gln) amidotransferase subunit A